MKKWKIDSAKRIKENKQYFQRAIIIFLLGIIFLVIIAQFTRGNNNSITGLLCTFGSISIVIIALILWADHVERHNQE